MEKIKLMKEIDIEAKLLDELNDLAQCKLCPMDLMDTIDEYLRIKIIKEKNKRTKKDIQDLLVIFDKLDWYLYFKEYIEVNYPQSYIEATEHADEEMDR